jgi:mRNA interferase MazF
MRQGEICEVYLDTITGSEQSNRRPSVIISGNLKTVISCPLTSKSKNYRGNLLVSPNKINGLSKKSEAMTVYIHSISKERFKNKLGTFISDKLSKIIESLNKIIKYQF